MTAPNYSGTLFLLPSTVTIIAPTAANDSTQGYQVGSRWLNTVTGNEYVCTNTTVGAAVWALTTADLTSQTEPANAVLAGPGTGSAALPTFRALVPADVPLLVPAIQSNAIADPGNAGAIPVTTTGNVLLVTAGAETRTIAAATAVGIELLLIFKTKVGNCVITVASTINNTGNNTITFGTAGVSIRLISVVSGTTYRWAVVYNDATTLTTV
jgi:hypothetical protein